MRIVVLGSSLYSETTCAMSIRLAEAGCVASGAMVLSTLDRRTLVRKLGQWGVREVVRYGGTKVIPRRDRGQIRIRNPYLQPILSKKDKDFRNLREVASFYGFPVAVRSDLNASASIDRLRQWSPDLIIFTGGNILRKPLLQIARVGVLNAHLGLLPEIRGMSSPEWSLLKDIPAGITIHFMDAGIDTGPVLQRHEFRDVSQCESLSDLRNRLIAFGVEKMAEVVTALDGNAISSTPQSDLDKDTQFFVMHEWLQARAVERLRKNQISAIAGVANG